MTQATRNKIFDFFISGWKFKDLVWLGTVAYGILKFGMYAEHTRMIAYSKMADFDTVVVTVKDNRNRLVVLQSSVDMYATKMSDSLEYYRDKTFYDNQIYYKNYVQKNKR